MTNSPSMSGRVGIHSSTFIRGNVWVCVLVKSETHTCRPSPLALRGPGAPFLALLVSVVRTSLWRGCYTRSAHISEVITRGREVSAKCCWHGELQHSTLCAPPLCVATLHNTHNVRACSASCSNCNSRGPWFDRVRTFRRIRARLSLRLVFMHAVLVTPCAVGV